MGLSEIYFSVQSTNPDIRSLKTIATDLIIFVDLKMWADIDATYPSYILMPCRFDYTKYKRVSYCAFVHGFT